MSERKDRYEEQRNDLIKSADKSVINDRAQIAVLKSHIIKFRDTAPENNNTYVIGTIRFIPLKIRVMGKVNYESSLYLSCDVIFEDLTGYMGSKSEFSSDINGLDGFFHAALNTSEDWDSWLNHICNQEFDKFVRLIGLSNYKLWINSITFNE